jgi:serine/threonine protein kinase
LKEDSLMQDRVGEQFGNYRLTQLIGRGGYAEVYLAEHIHLPNKEHAIKVLTGTNLKDEKREEFLFEARIIAKLQLLSSHIVQIQDFGVQPDQQGANSGTPYLVMEYAREGTLRNLYPQGTQMPLERIAFYTNQIAEALQCVHDQTPPIVHRDIKPENMLLRSRDHVLLSDFGIAIPGKTGPLAVSGGTKEQLVGTATYMAPERLQGRTRRGSDQYALAIVVYEWLCGDPPFEGTEKEICFQHLQKQPPRLYPAYAHVTPEIEAVVLRALAKDPEQRYPSVQEFARAMETAIEAALHPNAPWSQPTIPARGIGQPAQGPRPQPVLNMQGIGQPFQQQGASPAPNMQGMQQGVPPVPPNFQGVGQPAQWQKPQPMPPTPIPPTLIPQNIPGIGQPAQQQGVPLAPPNIQRSQWQDYYPLPDPSQDVTQADPTIALPLPPAAAPNLFGKKVRAFFELAPQFASAPKYSFFRTLGMILNILSALVIGLVLQNIIVPILGLIFSVLMFSWCIRAVETILAAFAGALVALYWGVVGWVLGGYLASFQQLQLDRTAAEVFVGIIFCCVSFGMHIWYITRKNIS